MGGGEEAGSELFEPWGLRRVQPLDLTSWTSTALDQGSVKYGLHTKSILPPGFVNEVWLKHSHAHSCTRRVQLHLRYKAELGGCDRDTQSPRYSHSGPVQTQFSVPRLRLQINQGCRHTKHPFHHAGLSNLPSSRTCFSHFCWHIWPVLIHCSCPCPALGLPHLVRQVLPGIK